MIKVVELFAGIGAQATALENLGLEHECIISEIDPHAIRMYEAMHGKTENLGDICEVEHIPDCDLVTWSFPCVDISKSGGRAGFSEGAGTRSATAWEVVRLVEDAVRRGRPPRHLVMENVPSILDTANVRDFRHMVTRLSRLGYQSTWSILDAKDFGVPQSRERCFMISEYGGQPFTFPKGFPLQTRLKDVLESDVDESYYLSEELVSKFVPVKRPEGDGIHQKGYLHKDAQHLRVYGVEGIAPCVAATDWKDSAKIIEGDGLILAGNLNNEHRLEQHNRVYDYNGLCPTLYTPHGGDKTPKIEDSTARIRHLTERETWRLFGYSDEMISRAFSVERSKTARYKASGNSIAVPVLEAIFRRLYLEPRTGGQTSLNFFAEVTE